MPDIRGIEGLRVYPAGVNARCPVFGYQFVGIGSLGKTWSEGHGDLGAFQFRSEVFAQFVN